MFCSEELWGPDLCSSSCPLRCRGDWGHQEYPSLLFRDLCHWPSSAGWPDPSSRPPSWHDPLCYHVPQALWTTPVSKNYSLYSDHIGDARTGTKQTPALGEFHCHHLRGGNCCSLSQAGRDEKECYLLSPVKEKKGAERQSLVNKALAL